LIGRFSGIAGDLWLGIAEVLQVERLVPEAQSAEEPNVRPAHLSVWSGSRIPVSVKQNG